MRNRILKRILLLFSIIGAVLLNLFLLARTTELGLPEAVESALKKNNVALEASTIESRLLPYPHFYVHEIDLRISGEVDLKLYNVVIKLELLPLILNQTEKIESIMVGRSTLHVLDTPTPVQPQQPGKPSVVRTKLQRVLAMTQSLMAEIPRQFNLAQTVQASVFELYIDWISKEVPLLNAFDIRLRNDQQRGGNVFFDTKASMGAWLHSHVHIEMRPNGQGTQNADHWIRNVSIRIESTVDFSQLKNSFDNIDIDMQGKAKVTQFLKFGFPLSDLRHRQSIEVENFRIADGKTTYIDMPEGAKVNMLLSGSADQDGVLADQFEIQFPRGDLEATAEWKFKDYAIRWDFAANQRLALSQAVRLVGNVLPSGVRRTLRNPRGTITPHTLVWKPWADVFDYDVSSRIALVKAIGENRFARPPYLRSRARGSGLRLKSDNARITGRGSKLSLKRLSLHLGDSTHFKTSLTGHIALQDFWDAGHGTMRIQGKLNCRLAVTRARLRCRRRNYRLSTSDTRVQAGTAARFYRFLSVDLFNYWRSLKPDSEVTLKAFNSNGHVAGDSVVFNDTLVKSDIGNFEFSGRWQPVRETGRFTLRLTPLSVDKVLRPIPVVGKAIQATLAFAAQMIFSLRLNKNDLSIDSLTIGKGFEKLRKFIGSTPE